jgi:hypothetical protein
MRKEISNTDVKKRTRSKQRGNITGTVLGILVFLAGAALLALTFKLAFDMFGTDPTRLFGLTPGKTLDLSKAVTLLMAVVVKILLLLVMAIISGLIANRGIHLYADSRHTKAMIVKERQPEQTEYRERHQEDPEHRDKRTGT